MQAKMGNYFVQNWGTTFKKGKLHQKGLEKLSTIKQQHWGQFMRFYNIARSSKDRSSKDTDEPVQMGNLTRAFTAYINKKRM